MNTNSIPLWITALCAVLGLAWLVIGGGEITGSDQKVLMVMRTEDVEEAMPATVFDEALRSGGMVKINFDVLRAAHPEIEDTVSDDGTFYPVGALTNYITRSGWNFHSSSFGNLLIFVR
jgi:hypothetical protein